MGRLQVSGPSPWRDNLGDPDLRDLLVRADQGALDNRIALAKLEQADAELEQATAALRPIATLGAAAAVGGRRLHQSTAAATPTAEASWEVDLWGRTARAREAARADRGAAQDDVLAARLLTGAETVRAYVAYRAAQQGVAVAEDRRRASDRAAALSRLRAAEGYTTGEAAAAAQHRADAAAGDEAAAREEAGLQLARLRDLTGDRALSLPNAALPLPASTAGEVASGVVEARPDVRAAYARLAAADARRAAAVAAAQPKFVISAALGAPDAALATLLDVRGLAWALAGAVSHQVLDGGARRAAVHQATAEADLADLGYRRTVLTAWQDVRTALVAQAAAARRVAVGRADLAAALDAQARAAARHREGLADGVILADQEQAVTAARDSLRAAQVQALEARVELRLATGGA